MLITEQEVISVNEEEAFRQIFNQNCIDAGFRILKDFPLYALTDGLSTINLRIIEPFSVAEIENSRKIKGAVPKKILENLKKEFAKKQKLKKENDTHRFSKILILCAKQILLLNDNPPKIIKIKTLLEMTKKVYSSLKIDVDELDMFDRTKNSGLIDIKLFPGRDPSNFVEITSSDGEKKRFALVHFKKLDLVEENE